MVDLEILQGFNSAVTVAVAGSLIPTLPIAYIDITFEPPEDQKYLELVFIPNNSEDFWGKEQNYQGMFRMILHWPLSGTGPYPPMRVIKSIADYFSKDRFFPAFKIATNPKFMGSLAGKGDLLYPVSVRYQRFAAN